MFITFPCTLEAFKGKHTDFCVLIGMHCMLCGFITTHACVRRGFDLCTKSFSQKRDWSNPGNALAAVMKFAEFCGSLFLIDWRYHISYLKISYARILYLIVIQINKNDKYNYNRLSYFKCCSVNRLNHHVIFQNSINKSFHASMFYTQTVVWWRKRAIGIPC